MGSFVESVKVYSWVNIKKMNRKTLERAQKLARERHLAFTYDVLSGRRPYDKKLSNDLATNYVNLYEECRNRGIR